MPLHGSVTRPIVKKVCIWDQNAGNVRGVVSCGSGPVVGGVLVSGAAGTPVSQTNSAGSVEGVRRRGKLQNG